MQGEPTMNVILNGIFEEVLLYFRGKTCLGFKGELEHCSKKLFAYGGKKIDAVSQFEAEISVASDKVASKFVVVKNGHCIL